MTHHVFVQEDYYLTPDKLWIPLRWIAPELLEEYRGSLIVTDQTKTSNVWYVLKLSQLKYQRHQVRLDTASLCGYFYDCAVFVSV